ncbi:MAG: hypothetical protein OEW82_07230, partial [Dehalococcoidia bacterium]|nr:hypothetical protein [Dehalococcoidia bacterium]
MNRKILLLGLSIILLILPISTSTSVWAQPMYPPPMIADITPSSGEQGQTLDLIISGHYFQDGASVSFSPPTGITINSLTIISAMGRRVNITIDPNAPAVPRDVTVTNPDAQYATLEGGFTVKAKGCTDLYLAYVKAQQAADEACLTYETLKSDAEKQINEAQKAIDSKENTLQDCLDNANKELEELAKEKDKLEKGIDQLKKQIEGIKGKIPGLEREEKLWYDLMQETAFEAGTELTVGVGTGVAKGILVVAGIATGPIGWIGLIIGGGLEIWSAAHTRSNLNY